jgi:pilus assembly protein CpaB
MLIICLAVVLALVGTGAVYAYVKNADDRALAGTKAADVLIVDRRIPAGTSVKDILSGGYLRRDHVPETALPKGAISSLKGDDMADLVATAELQTGQIVLKQAFGQLAPTTSGLIIPDGMMAVSFSVKTPGDVVDYVQPKSQIAIFATFTLLPNAAPNATPDPNGGDKATKLLLPRVQVLAVSQPAPKDTGSAKGAGDLQLTVALNQADAERLIHEMVNGSLYLALLTDKSKSEPAPGVDDKGVLGPIFPAGS